MSWHHRLWVRGLRDATARMNRVLKRKWRGVLAAVAFAALAIVLTTGTLKSTGGTDVVTYHNDVARTGQNLNESTLTPAKVNVSAFGKLAVFTVDGKVDAQPLHLAGLAIPGSGTRDVLYVATEHDSVYAMDAITGAVLWRTSLLGAGETTSDTRSCSQVVPEIGITSTPVIDRSRSANGVIYVVAMSKNASGAYFQRLHALDAVLGTELFGGPQAIQASFPGSGPNSSNGSVVFDPKQYEERAGLLLINGQIVTTWTSHCDIDPYNGWIIAFDAGTLSRTSVLNVTPNGSRGGIWMSGAGPAADAQGNVYLLDGNGTFDTTLAGSGFPLGDFGNAFLKIATAGGLSVADYFATFDTVSASNADTDLGSGGAMVLPDLVDAAGRTRHLAVGAGKDSHIYLVDRDAMGKWNASSNQNYQDITDALGGSVFAMPAYFNNTVYYGASGNTLRAFSVTSARLSSAAISATAGAFVFPGTTPSVSASGSENGIVWAVENRNPAVLHAYDAGDLSHELYNSSQAPNSRDAFGAGNKFITPTIANGRVYVGTTNGVGVFGVFGPATPSNIRIIPQ